MKLYLLITLVIALTALYFILTIGRHVPCVLMQVLGVNG